MPFIDRSGLHIPGFAIPEVATGYSVVPGDYNANSGAEAAELIWTGAYGDGKPMSTAWDRQIAANFNRFTDYISATQMPMLVAGSEVGATDIDDVIADVSATLFLYPIFVGLDTLGTTITRVLTVAPWLRSTTGAAAEIRVTITDRVPQPHPSSPEDVAIVSYYGSPFFVGRFSQSTIWTTPSTTWATGAEYELNIGCKTNLGFVWCLIEGAAHAECRGLAVTRVSERRVT